MYVVKVHLNLNLHLYIYTNITSNTHMCSCCCVTAWSNFGSFLVLLGGAFFFQILWRIVRIFLATAGRRRSLKQIQILQLFCLECKSVRH